MNGSKAVFTTKAPFINVEFLTDKPQTLHVFEPKEAYEAIQANNRKVIGLRSDAALSKNDTEKAETYQSEIENLLAESETFDIARKADRLLYSDNEYRALQIPPDKADYVYATYAYSGGGIGPAIIGATACFRSRLVAIALTLGVLCAIYLSEYSKPGRMLQLVRLSVLNLSGVPSIVFGLFGIWNVRALL